MSKLNDESPRLFRPTLAAWIGLNESIFLEQLNFILTKTDKGRFADGKKWYRDTPRAFMIQYFPFWDESIVKRTITNLRADALILARSDLNDDPKDRSLWYTINYPALERLAGPVERITGKSDKRKEARKARRSKPDNYPDYTKVQNVLMPDEAGTNSTSDSQQNVLLPSVQIVPTPKESLILQESKAKDTSPYGEGGKPPAIKIIEPELELPLPEVEESTKKVNRKAYPAVKVFVEVTGKYVLNNTQMDEINKRVGHDPPNLEKWRKTITAWQLQGNKINNANGMLKWFKIGIPDYAQEGQPTNGHYSSKSTAYGTQAEKRAGEDSEGVISPERAAKLARLTR